MTTSHTPGPWGHDQTIGAEDFCVFQATQKAPLVADKCTEPDAWLIAASPDLLDALRRVLRHIPDDAGGASLSDDIYRAKRAIARATSGE